MRAGIPVVSAVQGKRQRRVELSERDGRAPGLGFRFVGFDSGFRVSELGVVVVSTGCVRAAP